MATPPSFNPARGTPLAGLSSLGKSVLLYDWWLIEAESECGGRRLGVGGLMTREGQQATRVFSSAPIIKRYDAYTLETSDGITVRIQGLINNTRAVDAGVPLEVCNRFLIGFPYNWNYYADKYFGNRSSSISVNTSASDIKEPFEHSSNNTDGKFPMQLDEFPLREMIDAIISNNYDSLSKKHSGILRDIGISTSNNAEVPAKMPTTRESLPEESLSKNEPDKAIQNHGDGVRYSCLINPDAEGHAATHAKEASSRVNTECSSLPEAGGMQKEPLLENITDPEKVNNVVDSLLADISPAVHLPNVTKGNDGSPQNSTHLGVESVSNDLVEDTLTKNELDKDIQTHGNRLGKYSSIRESLPQDSLNKNEPDKGIHTHGNVMGYSVTINPGADGLAAAHAEKASSHVNKECHGLGMQKEHLLENVTDPEKVDNVVDSLLADIDLAVCFLNVSKRNNESPHHSTHLGAGSVSNDLVLKKGKSSHLTHEYELGNYALRSRICLKETKMQDIGASEDLQRRKDETSSATKRKKSSETMPEPSELSSMNARLAEEKTNRIEIDKINHNYKSRIGYASVAQGHRQAEKAGCHRNDLHVDEVLRKKSGIGKTTKSSYEIPADKSIQINTEYNGLAESRMGVQEELMLESTPGPDNNNIESLPGNLDQAGHLLNETERELNDEKKTNLSDLAIENVYSDTVLIKETPSCLKHDKEMGKYALRSRVCLKNMSLYSIGVSEDLQVRKNDRKGANSSNIEVNLMVETSLNPLQNGMPQNLDDASTSNLVGPGIGSASDDLLQKEGNHLHVQHGNKHKKSGLCFIENRRKTRKRRMHGIGVSEDLLSRKDSSTKGGKSLTVKLDVPSETSLDFDATKTYNVSDTKKSEKTISRNSSSKKTSVLSSLPEFRDVGHQCYVDGQRMDANSLKTHDDEISRISKESTSEVAMCFTKQLSSKLVGGRGRDGFPILSSRLKKLKTKWEDDQRVGSRLEVGKEVRTSTVDHNLANAVNDKGLTITRGEKGIPESSPREPETKICIELQACSASAAAFSDGKPRDGDLQSRNQVALDNSKKDKSFKSSVRSSVRDASHSGSGNVHHRTNKVSDRIRKRITKETNSHDANQSDVLAKAQPTKHKALHRTRSKVIWKPSYVPQSPQTRDMTKNLSVASPESLNLRRSRSGRFLVPPIANWCQKILYDAGGAITGITAGVDKLNSTQTGSKLEPARKKRKIR